MMRLNELYPDSPSDVMIKGIKINSQEVKEGDLFVCTKGVHADRHDFIDDAIKNGASAIVVGRKDIKISCPTIFVEDPNYELPLLCAKFYDYPNKKMKMIGVTGTDGKTSVATIIQTLLGSEDCGYIGTNGRSCKDFQKDDNPNTTPDVHLLYPFLDDFVKSGCRYTAMEASSEAFYRGRLQGFFFDVSVYTNITEEHLNIHGTFENYLQCKAKLFEQTKKEGYCILNKDDVYYEEMRKHCQGKVYTYGTKDADLTIVSYKLYPQKTDITFKYHDKEYSFSSPLLGDFNVSNLAAGMLACLALGKSMESLLANVMKIRIRGRLELLKTNTPYYVMVDYAHTPNGITRLLNFIHTLDVNRSIVVIGSAGERDFKKRPIMGEVVLKNANYAIFTSEDPRSEDPKAIVEQMVSTSQDQRDRYCFILDRRDAITKAISMAKAKDIVLILGKGDESYQKLKDKTIYFNDIEEAYRAVAMLEEEKTSDAEEVL